MEAFTSPVSMRTDSLSCSHNVCHQRKRRLVRQMRPQMNPQKHLQAKPHVHRQYTPYARAAPAGSPLASLETGTWFKLICGASSHDAPSIRNLCAVYTAAGADCVDVACDRAVIRAARAGIARGLARRASSHTPLLMVSVNAGADPHFRKAMFDPALCPADCPRPCEMSCPAEAIGLSGVVADRCYGCGRCVPVCPLGLVVAEDIVHDTRFVSNVLTDVDAVEIHVGRGQAEEFHALWRDIGAAAARLQVVAVSLPDLGGDRALEDGLRGLWETMAAGGSGVGEGGARLVWQADGRPMSGDIGRGTAKAAVELGVRVRAAMNRAGLPGEVQLAGGTNDATVPLMERAGLRRSSKRVSDTAAGIAVGGYARKIVKQALEDFGGSDAELSDEAFDRALIAANILVGSIKSAGTSVYSAQISD